MNTGLLVGLIIGGVLAFNAVLWIVILGARKRRSVALKASLSAELSASGEQILRGPAVAQKRIGHASRTGWLVLTNRRLIFINGARLDLPLAELESVRGTTTFNGSYRGGWEWLIVSRPSASGPEEIGFVSSVPGWVDATRGLVRQR